MLKNYIKGFFLQTIFISLTYVNYAQTPRLSEKNSIAWLDLFVTAPIKSKWSFHNDIQIRRVDGIKNPQQMLYRFGINYQVMPDVLIRVGGAFVQTFPYGINPLNNYSKKTEEYRLFQMITLSHIIKYLDFSHRFMLEQRWNGKYNTASDTKPNSWPLSHRLRYMVKAQISLNKKNKYYLTGYNELFVAFGKNVGENIFDQNRLTLFIGRNWTKSIRSEFGYLAQTQQLSREINGSNVIHYNKGCILNTYFNLAP